MLDLAEALCGFDKTGSHGMVLRWLAGRDHTRTAADRALAAGVAVDLLEIPHDLLEAPVGSSSRLPLVVVGLVALEPDGCVDARSAADDFSDWRHDDAVIQMRLGRGIVAPVGVSAEVANIEARIGDLLLLDIGAATFDHQHGGAAILRQAVRHDAAGGARADDNVVVFAL